MIDEKKLQRILDHYREKLATEEQRDNLLTDLLTHCWPTRLSQDY